MKKTNPFSIVLILSVGLCVIFFSCIKKPTPIAVLPQVGLGPITYYSLDTVMAKATIISTGNAHITSEGFICSTNPNFGGYPPQIIASGSPNFSSLIHAIHYTTYYFKAFATNSVGTAYSNVIEYTVPPPPPATATCTLANNVIIDSGTSTFIVTVSGNSTSPAFGNYQVSFYGQNEDVYMYFPDLPHNGIYSTVADPTNISAGQVSMGMSGISGTSVNDGQKVYVALDTINHKTIITFCPLSYNMGGLGTAYISGKGTY